MNVLKFIFILLEVLLLFNVLIFVHELGHFLAARWRGLKIQRFAIWFGKPIWKKKFNGVEYALGTIPFGGYVSLPQMAPMEMIEGKAEEENSEEPEEPLPPISALDKIIVAFAGPLFSFGLAVLFAVVVWQVGRPLSESETTTTIGYVDEDGPAARAGLEVGDKILSIDGKPVTKFSGMGSSVTWRIVRSVDTSIPVTVLRNGKELTFQVQPTKEETKPWERKSLRKIMIGPAYTPIVGKVVPNSPAALAGIKPLDEILEFNGTKLYHWAQLDEFATNHPNTQITLSGLRDRKPIRFTLKPETPVSPPDEVPQLGILWEGGGKMRLAHLGVWHQVYDSVDALVSTLGALFSPKSDIKPQHLSGAVKILNIYYILFESEHGWRMALWFSVLLNVNLAILNLLPIPVLDGGHILLAIVESARRRPVSPKLLQYIQTGCAVLLIGYMLYVTFYDVQDLGLTRKKESLPELKFAPKTPPPPQLKPAP
jgi:regulator of sigma E protease